MKKVKVSNEVFEALESLKLKLGEKFKSNLNFFVIKNKLEEHEEVLRSCLTLEELVDIAYCGYELEMTKEEKMLEIYEQHKDSAYGFGIERALSVLGIKIKGINT